MAHVLGSRSLSRAYLDRRSHLLDTLVPRRDKTGLDTLRAVVEDQHPPSPSNCAWGQALERAFYSVEAGGIAEVVAAHFFGAGGGLVGLMSGWLRKSG